VSCIRNTAALEVRKAGTCRCTNGGCGFSDFGVHPPGWSRTEVVCHDMQKKVIPFPSRKVADSRLLTEGHSRVTIHVGAQRYTLNIPREDVALPPAPVLAVRKGRLEKLQVQTRFLHLRQPAGLGDRIDGWRVCWVGGWDKGRVLFVVMVKRVVGVAQA